MAPNEGRIQPAVALREGVRGDEYPTPSHPLFPAGASFRGQVDTLGAQRTVESGSGGRGNPVQDVVITDMSFTVLLISLGDEHK